MQIDELPETLGDLEEFELLNEPADDDSDPPLLIGDYKPELVEPWIAYLYGKWEKGAPDLPGTYAVASLEGDVLGYREWDMRDGKVEQVGRGYKEPGWLGWRWSVSLPNPPKETPSDEP